MNSTLHRTSLLSLLHRYSEEGYLEPLLASSITTSSVLPHSLRPCLISLTQELVKIRQGLRVIDAADPAIISIVQPVRDLATLIKKSIDRKVFAIIVRAGLEILAEQPEFVRSFRYSLDTLCRLAIERSLAGHVLLDRWSKSATLVWALSRRIHLTVAIVRALCILRRPVPQDSAKRALLESTILSENAECTTQMCKGLQIPEPWTCSPRA